MKYKGVLYLHCNSTVRNTRTLFTLNLLLLALSSSKISMGISVEQYRSRIRFHDNFVKAKDSLSCFKDHVWNMMLTMFYLRVFYLPTLKLVVTNTKYGMK